MATLICLKYLQLCNLLEYSHVYNVCVQGPLSPFKKERLKEAH